MDQKTIDTINEFVRYLIVESCEGCDLCEPLLSSEWHPDLACRNEGEAKWLLQKAEEFIKEKECDVI